MSEKLNQNLETYKIESELGRDDLTIAYQAHRKSDHQPVMIRVVAPQFTFDTYFVRRFKDAVARSIKLDHPNIVKTYEVGEREDILYVARELIEADTLADYLGARGPLPVKEVVALAKQIASAMDYAHSQGIKHGDLSDTNIFVKDGHAWLTDFGLIQAIEGTSLVKKGFAIGNPIYLSPERVKGESPSRTADLYALGVLCYQMLVGKPPFSGEPAGILHAQIYEQPEAPHLLNSSIRPSISEVVLRMLSKGLELRHSTGAEFARALQVAAEGSAPIKPPPKEKVSPRSTVSPSPSPIWKRLVFWVFILTPILGCALAGGFWAISQWDNITPSASPTAVARQDNPTPVPTFRVDVPTSPPPITQNTPEPTATPILPTVTPTSTPEPTATPIPLPGEPIIAEDSPFTNLVLAHNITEDYSPERPTNIFSPTEDPIYLFFDYTRIQPGTSWGLVWKWDDLVLERTEDIWPEDYGSDGTAWVYFAPPFGFQPGPYAVSLQLDGGEVATINFIVQPE
jgi:serine/threonine-protein kinase